MGKQSEASLHVVGSWGLGAWKGKMLLLKPLN